MNKFTDTEYIAAIRSARDLFDAMKWPQTGDTDAGDTVFACCPVCGEVDFRGHEAGCEYFKTMEILDAILSKETIRPESATNTFGKMDDRTGVMMSAALMLVAVTQGSEDDVKQAARGYDGLAYLAGKYGSHAADVVEVIKRIFPVAHNQVQNP